MDSFKEGLAAFARNAARPKRGPSAPIISAQQVGETQPFRMHSLEPFSTDGDGLGAMTEAGESLDEQLEKRFQQGYEAGQEATQRAFEREQQQTWQRLGQSLAQRVAALQSEFEAELLAREQRIAESLLDLALEVAAKIVARQIAIDHDHSLAVVQECLAQLPTPAQGLRLCVNPDDAQGLLETGPLLRERAIEIVADASVAAGGCRIRNEHFEIDSTLRTRWRRTLAALGRTDPPDAPGEDGP